MKQNNMTEKYFAPECNFALLESVNILCASGSDLTNGNIDSWDLTDPSNENPITF